MCASDRPHRPQSLVYGSVRAGRIALCVLGFLGASDVTTVFVLTGLTLLGITSLNLAIYLYTPELYPTRLRAQGVGIALAWSRVAAMVAPPVIDGHGQQWTGQRVRGARDRGGCARDGMAGGRNASQGA